MEGVGERAAKMPGGVGDGLLGCSETAGALLSSSSLSMVEMSYRAL